MNQLIKFITLCLTLISHSAYSETSSDCKGKIRDYSEVNFSFDRLDNLTDKNNNADITDERFSFLFYSRKSGYKFFDSCKTVGQIEFAAGTEFYNNDDIDEDELLAINLGAYYSLIRLGENEKLVLPYNSDLPLYNAIGVNLVPTYVDSEKKLITTSLLYTSRTPYDLNKLFSTDSGQINILETDFDLSIDRQIIDGFDDRTVFNAFLEVEHIKEHYNGLDRYIPKNSYGLSVDYTNNLSDTEINNDSNNGRILLESDHVVDYELFYRKKIVSNDIEYGIEPFLRYKSIDNSDPEKSFGANFTIRWY